MKPISYDHAAMLALLEPCRDQQVRRGKSVREEGKTERGEGGQEGCEQWDW